MLQLGASTQTCNGCHSHLPIHVEFTARLENLRQGLASILEPASANPPADGAVSIRTIEASINALEDGRGQMEARFHQLLERRRESGKTILQPSLWQQLALVVGGLVAALLLAWLMSRAMSRPILPLIAAARRIGSGNDKGPPRSSQPGGRRASVRDVVWVMRLEQIVLVLHENGRKRSSPHAGHFKYVKPWAGSPHANRASSSPFTMLYARASACATNSTRCARTTW
jgi:hypothetical protein